MHDPDEKEARRLCFRWANLVVERGEGFKRNGQNRVKKQVRDALRRKLLN